MHNDQAKNLHFLFAGLILLIGGFVNACGSEDVIQEQGFTETGTVVLLLTDDPAENFSEVNVTVNEISLLSDSRPPVVFFNDERRINLLSLEEDNELLLIHDEVPAGLYHKIRLRISDPEFVPLEGPPISGSQIHLVAGGKLDLLHRAPFHVKPGSQLRIVLDFDVKKSIKIHESGSGYHLRPVIFIKILDEIETHFVSMKGVIVSMDADNRTFMLKTDYHVFHRPHLAGHSEGDRPERLILIKVNEAETSIFGPDGKPGNFDTLETGQHVIVRGLLTSENGYYIDASLIKIGGLLRLHGVITSDLDGNNQFGFQSDPGQGILAAGFTVQAEAETLLIEAGTHRRLTLDTLKEGRRLLIEGVLDLESSIFHATFIVVKPIGAPAQPLLGRIWGDPHVDEITKARTFTLLQENESRILVRVIKDAAILRIHQGEEGSLQIELIRFSFLRDGHEVQLFGHFNQDGSFDAKIIVVEEPVTSPPPPPSTAVILPDVGAALSVSVDTVCELEVSHRLHVSWQLNETTGRETAKITAILADGTMQTQTVIRTEGRTEFELQSPDGSHVTALLHVESTEGSATDSAVSILPACIEIPRPDPGEGFTTPPAIPPEPPIGIPGSPINETDMIHVGGSPLEGELTTRLVTVVGTGSVTQLSSWTVDQNLMPIHMMNSETVIGYNAKLHVLTPPVSPKLEPSPFISGVIRDDKLWLTTWMLNNDGSFKKFSTQGYGQDVSVKEYAIAHRTVTVNDSKKFQIVTPVLTTDDNIRLITWSVAYNTGEINGLQDSGNTPSIPASETALSIAHLKDAEGVDYVVTFSDPNGKMSTQFWEVFSTGAPFLRGGGTSGLNLRGTGGVLETAEQTHVLPLNKGGYVTAAVLDSTQTLSVWDYHAPGFEVLLVPHKIADNTLDLSPGAFGIDIGPEPTLTDGSHEKIEDGAIQKVRAILTDDLWEEKFGIGEGKVVNVFPLFEFPSVGIASVTKVMTLLLAVEAINNQVVSLDDIVTVSKKAADTGGSSMNLQEGEKQKLRTLLYGMMLISGNDASVAIAEHVAGSSETFVNWMNIKANLLGLTKTSYNQPAGGGYSTPQDQVTLFRFGAKDPLFLKIAREKTFYACGESKNGAEICHDLVKFNDNGYPGLNGWKNGNLGFHDPELKEEGVPLCVSCLLAQAKRANRTYLTSIQQSGNRWGDAGNLFDFGFRKLFTPDRRGSLGLVGGQFQDLALDYLSDMLAVTAVIDFKDDLRVCSWSVNAGSGQIESPICGEMGFQNLPGDNVRRAIPTLIDGVRLSTLLAEGDYFTAQNDSGNLMLRLWRIAPKEP